MKSLHPQPQRSFKPLSQVTQPAVDTEAAAHYLNRRPQTLRSWAVDTHREPPIRPLRINGRLAWPVAGLKQLLGVQQ